MLTVKTQTPIQYPVDRELNELSLLNTYAWELLRRVPSTKIQCTTDEEKILVEENEDISKKDDKIPRLTTAYQRSAQQEPVIPTIQTSNEPNIKAVSDQSNASTKVGKRHHGSVREWIRRKLRFFSRKKNTAGDVHKNVT